MQLNYAFMQEVYFLEKKEGGGGEGFFCTTVWGNFTCLQEI